MRNPEWLGLDPDMDYQVYKIGHQTARKASTFFRGMMKGELQECMSSTAWSNPTYKVTECLLPWEFFE